MRDEAPDADAPPDQPDEPQNAALRAAADAGGKWRRRLRRMSPFFGLALLCAAIWIIYRELSVHSISEIWAMLRQVKLSTFLFTIGLCGVSYVMLGLIEHLTLQMLHRQQNFLSVLKSSFVTYGTSNALGFAFATAPAARARIYRGRLRGREIGALSAITAASVALGAVTAGGLSLVFGAQSLPLLGFGGAHAWRWLGGVLLIPAIVWVLASGSARNALDVMGIKVRTLGYQRASAQVAFTTIDWLSTAGILYCFVPHGADWNYISFVSAFVASGLIGAVSGTPGGLGTFEAAILSLAPASAGTVALAAALVAYRIVFTVLPLVAASCVLALDFLRKPHAPH